MKAREKKFGNVLHVPDSACPIWVHTGDRYLALTTREAKALRGQLDKAIARGRKVKKARTR
jgi:hypothetical protein